MRTQDASIMTNSSASITGPAKTPLGLKISKLSLLMLDHDVKIETRRTREDIPLVVETIDKTAYEMIHEEKNSRRARINTARVATTCTIARCVTKCLPTNL